MAIQIDVDVSDALDGIRELSDAMPEIADNAIKRIAQKSVRIAKVRHSFKSRSGALVRSVRSEDTDDGYRVYLDTAIAPYASYIHNGTSRISADPFLENAVDQAITEIPVAFDQELESKARSIGFVVH